VRHDVDGAVELLLMSGHQASVAFGVAAG